MLIYKEKKQFDPNTGKKTQPILVKAGAFCDFSGTMILDKDDKFSLYTVKFNDQSGSEQYWYYDSHPIIERLAKELKVDDYAVRQALNETAFHFSVADHGGNDHDFSGALVSEWVKEFNIKDSLFFECRDLPTACALARYRTITRLLDQGKLKAIELGIDQKICGDEEYEY